jgi:MGT family glycosyltransferase
LGDGGWIFIGMNGGFGPLAQVLPIANELNNRGYEIICHNYRAASEMVKKMGYTFYDLPETIGRPKIVNPNGPEWWNADYQWSKHGYMDYDFTKRLVEAFIEALQTYQPKAVLSVQFPLAVVAARRLGIPVACITQACLHKAGRGGRTTWWKDLPDNLDRTSPIFNRILNELGMTPIETMEDLSDGDITIIPSIPEFDVVHDPNVFYTGPMFWQGPGEISGVPYNIPRKNKYLIHAYTGHLFNSAGRPTGITLLSNIVNAFNDTEFDVLISTGTGQKVPSEIEPAQNVTISEWVPANQVIPQCDLIVHHGGHGYSLQCLAHGIPSIVLPLTDEREYNARQSFDLGIGLFITPDQMNPKLILAKARDIMSNPEMKERSRTMAETVRQRNYHGAFEAARMIEALTQN